MRWYHAPRPTAGARRRQSKCTTCDVACTPASVRPAHTTGIGSPAISRQGRFQRILYGTAAALRLPATESTAVVFDTERDPHTRQIPTTRSIAAARKNQSLIQRASARIEIDRVGAAVDSDVGHQQGLPVLRGRLLRIMKGQRQANHRTIDIEADIAADAAADRRPAIKRSIGVVSSKPATAAKTSISRPSWGPPQKYLHRLGP